MGGIALGDFKEAALNTGVFGLCIMLTGSLAEPKALLLGMKSMTESLILAQILTANAFKNGRRTPQPLVARLSSSGWDRATTSYAATSDEDVNRYDRPDSGGRY